MEVGQGAGEVEGDVEKLTTASIRAEEDRREGLDVGAELRAEQQLRRPGDVRFRGGVGLSWARGGAA